MHTLLEDVKCDEGSSISVLENPNLSDFYFWHFHPEIELVFIAEVDGIRQVGNHISKFQNGELALIGSNIPQLNFDIGIRARIKNLQPIFCPIFWEQEFRKQKILRAFFIYVNMGLSLAKAQKRE
jgi:hypothetical protein